MAILPNGIGGLVTGKVGNMEFYVLNGVQCLRGERDQVTKPPSLKMLAQRNVAKLLGSFLSEVKSVLDIGFAESAKSAKGTAFNCAQSYCMRNVVTGIYPNQYVDYSKVLVTRGSLMPAINPSVVVIDDKLIVSWEKESSKENENDHLMLLLWIPKTERTVIELCGSKRSIGQQIFPILPYMKGQIIEVYISFRAEYNMNCSESIYIGSIPF